MLLARSGDTAPLDIYINMKGHFMDDLPSYEDHEYAKRALDALEFIVAHGGVTSRWEILVIWSNMPDVILAVMHFVRNAHLGNLHTLELDNETYKLLEGDELVAEVLTGPAPPESVIFRTQPPLLRHIELSGIPPSFLFQHGPIPLVCNLTSLNLTVVGSLPHLVGLRELFIHSPRLETLGLYTARIESIGFQYQPPATTRARMPHLRQFTHHQWDSVSWGLCVLKMVDAPRVEVFSLDLSCIQDDTILSYLASGRRGERLVDDHSSLNEHTDGTAIYPELKHLIIGSLSTSPKMFGDMLKASQNVTRLDWDLRLGSGADLCTVLGEATVCPQLEHLRVYQVPDELRMVVRQRAEQGRPLKIVEVNSFFWDEIPRSTRRELRRFLGRFAPYRDLEYCSDANEDDDISESTDGDVDEGSRVVDILQEYLPIQFSVDT